ncbi:protein TBRG4 isoform X2 [Orussus abietinus]|nr:protein TBRG4 isoform X2 [Orussus abietinus]
MDIINKSRKSTTASQMLTSSSDTIIDNLLNLTSDIKLSKEKASETLSKLKQWAEQNNISMVKYEKDERYKKLYRATKHTEKKSKVVNVIESDRMEMINHLSLADSIDHLTDNELAALQVSEMIQLLEALAQKRRRPVPLLKAMTSNLTRRLKDSELDIKRLSDLLYSISILNFPEEPLLDQICIKLRDMIKDNKNSAVIGSIFTSLGQLRYKNETLLTALYDWMLENTDIIRPRDLTACVLTVATLGHISNSSINIFKQIVKPIGEVNLTKSDNWLDIVWSAAILEQVTEEQVSSVLNKQYIERLEVSRGVAVPKKFKLLQVNAYAQLIMKNYQGPLLDKNSEIFSVSLERAKEKILLAEALFDALNRLLPSSSYLNKNINTGMGLLLDAEFYMDSEGNPVLVKNQNETSPNLIKVAAVIQNYHDTCKGKQDPVGLFTLFIKLLKQKGYEVLVIPYTEFKSTDTLVERIKYISKRLKSIAKKPAT